MPPAERLAQSLLQSPAPSSTSTTTVDAMKMASGDAVISEDSERGEPKYSVGTKIKRYSNTKGWRTADVVGTSNEGYYIVVYEDGDKEPLTEAEMIPLVPLASITIGTRVAVYSKTEKRYRDASVAKIRSHRTKNYYLCYDFGAREWTDLSTARYQTLEQQPQDQAMTLASENIESTLSPRATKKTKPLSAAVIAAELPTLPVSSSTSQPPGDFQPDDPSSVNIGTRISLWWPEDEEFYEATVVRMRRQGQDRFYLEFDDGLREWMDLRTLAFCIIGTDEDHDEELVDFEDDDNVLVDSDAELPEAEPEPAPAATPPSTAEAIAPEPEQPLEEAVVKTTTTSEVQAEPETNVDNNDDEMEETETEQEWSEDELEPNPDPDHVLVGSRVGVWWPDDRKYYNAEVMEYRRKKLPFRILYDDDEEEWIDFNQHQFKFLPGSKRKTCGRKKKRPPASKDEVSDIVVGTRIGVWWPDDKVYYKAVVQQVSKRPKPFFLLYDDGDTEWINLTHHDFYVVKEEDVDSETEGQKLLRNRRGSILHESSENDAEELEDSDDESDADEVDKVQVGTRVSIWWPGEKQYFDGTVTKTRRSKRGFYVEYDDGDREWTDLRAEKFQLLEESDEQATSETEEPGVGHVSDVGEVEQSDSEDEKPHAQEPPNKKRKLTGPEVRSTPVEQVDLTTGKVVKVWSSVRLAESKTGIGRGSIRRVLRRKGRPDAGGFFWRYAGDSSGPWVEPAHKNKKPVEQICPRTGDVLAEFDSIKDARESVGEGWLGCIGDVCDGKTKSALGYFWRWKGSKLLPEELKGLKKMVEVRETVGGPIEQRFDSVKEAAQWIDADVRLVSQWCRESKKCKGLVWSYHLVPAAEEERFCGRRLQIRLSSQGNNWEEGTVRSFEKSTKKYEIALDNGHIEYVDLRNATYNLRSESGDEPIEQVCIATGKVLNTFPNASVAAKTVNTKRRRILPVLRNVSASASGFFWRYQGSTAKPDPNLVVCAKEVEQIDLKTGEVVATHASSTLAGKQVGLSGKDIRRCCRDATGATHASGFGWRYKLGEGRRAH